MFTEIKLAKEVFVENEIGEKVKSISFSSTTYFCEEKSVNRSEFYQAMQSGLKAELIVKMNKYEYYEYYADVMSQQHKEYCKVLNSVTNQYIEYTIVRVYEKNDDYIELTLTRGIENASS